MQIFNSLSWLETNVEQVKTKVNICTQKHSMVIATL